MSTGRGAAAVLRGALVPTRGSVAIPRRAPLPSRYALHAGVMEDGELRGYGPTGGGAFVHVVGCPFT